MPPASVTRPAMLAGATASDNVPICPEGIVAVIVVTPAATRVTSPVLDTKATDGLLERQTAAEVTSDFAPSGNVSSAVSCPVCPGKVSAGGAMMWTLGLAAPPGPVGVCLPQETSHVIEMTAAHVKTTRRFMALSCTDGISDRKGSGNKGA